MLDKHCTACHQKEPKSPNLAATPATAEDHKRALVAWERTKGVGLLFSTRGKGWSSAMVGLSPFAQPRLDGLRSTPGQVGARVSPLYQLLKQGHHGVKLPPEDLHRLIVWLDTGANFFGAYHDYEAQARGELVRPKLE